MAKVRAMLEVPVVAPVSGRKQGHGRLISLHMAQTFYNIIQNTIINKLLYLIQNININKLLKTPSVKFV